MKREEIRKRREEGDKEGSKERVKKKKYGRNS